MSWRDEEYTDMERGLKKEVNRLRSVVRNLEEEKTESQKTVVKRLLEKSAEEIENLYGRETELSEEIRDFLKQMN